MEQLHWIDLAKVVGKGEDAVTWVSEQGIILNTVILTFCDTCVD